MKFDFIIGNPPYQEDTEGTSDNPIYNDFMDASYQLSDKVELISPARFLFNAGKTPKAWNEKMLNDPHVKVLYYEQNSGKVFGNTDIKGGVAITYRDRTKNFGPIEVFTSYNELNDIREKIVNRKDFDTFSDLIFAPESYKFSDSIHKDHPEIRFKEVEGENIGRLSKGHDYDIVTNIFEKLPDIFLDSKPQDGKEYVGFVGLIDNKRYTKWIRRDYIKDHENLEKYKVILPKSNGSGAIGEVLSTPLIGEPLIGHTQSFISIGSFDSQVEAINAMKYIKTKFARTALGILKITQDNKKGTWRFVPLQDFTSTSDIDWSKSVAEVDQQLYAKYGLDEKEIEFIESHVKEME